MFQSVRPRTPTAFQWFAIGATVNGVAEQVVACAVPGLSVSDGHWPARSRERRRRARNRERSDDVAGHGGLRWFRGGSAARQESARGRRSFMSREHGRFFSKNDLERPLRRRNSGHNPEKPSVRRRERREERHEVVELLRRQLRRDPVVATELLPGRRAQAGGGPSAEACADLVLILDIRRKGFSRIAARSRPISRRSVTCLRTASESCATEPSRK